MGKQTEKNAFRYRQWGKGILAVLLLYALGLVLGTGLVLREWVTEAGILRYTQIAMGVSIFLPCLVGRRTGWSLADCLLVGILSVALVASFGYMLYDTASILAHGLGFLIAGIVGAFLATLLGGSRKGHKRKGQKKRR